MLYVDPLDLSEFFLDPIRHKQLEDTYILIAAQDERKIYLTADKGFPRLRIEVDGEPPHNEFLRDYTPKSMADAFQKLIWHYNIYPCFAGVPDPDEPLPGGTKIRIKDDFDPTKQEKAQYRGQYATITSRRGYFDIYRIDIDRGAHWWYLTDFDVIEINFGGPLSPTYKT